MTYKRRGNICVIAFILSQITLLIVGITYLCVDHGPTTSDIAKEVAVLREDIQFLRTELSTQIPSFQLALADLLQELDTGVGTSHEILSNLDNTSKKIVKDAGQFYDVTKTGQIDYAMGSLGGSIVSTRDTKNHVSSPSETGNRAAQQILEPCTMPGECWAFDGSGAVVIQLIGKVNVKAVSVEHTSRSQLLPGLIKSAPKDFSVWGLNSLDDEGQYLGSFSYDIDSSPLQHFTIPEPAAIPFRFIELKIYNNHGKESYTCLYRFRVHGTLEPPEQA
ncbi:SUN domain-containing protein 2 isoform X1 [Cryptotermes secundus]|uniref:SUN domain-containing protein 2 isoform X1 n=1 Tax=Cryptotermes secundus TaxID=105785 RepID=UPI000CD7DEB5|nr:SUN domain-containing protein 2 isoform X1 [Cryptotermes secundus]